MAKESSGHGIATLPQGFQPGTTSYQKMQRLWFGIEQTLDKIFPVTLFMDLIENEEIGGVWPGLIMNELTMIKIIIVEVIRFGIVRGNMLGKPCFSHLPGAGQKNDFLF